MQLFYFKAESLSRMSVTMYLAFAKLCWLNCQNFGLFAKVTQTTKMLLDARVERNIE